MSELTTQDSTQSRSVSFFVNGVPRTVSALPDATLLDVLRTDLGLTGTKKGCGGGECGACTVLLDGNPVSSCILPVLKAEGRRVETIEGLGTRGELHPLQSWFLKLGAVHCGFCTPGMLMSAKALLDSNPNPSTVKPSIVASAFSTQTTGRVFAGTAKQAGMLAKAWIIVVA